MSESSSVSYPICPACGLDVRSDSTHYDSRTWHTLCWCNHFHQPVSPSELERTSRNDGTITAQAARIAELEAQVADMFTCSTCGAMFPKHGRAELWEGVTQCSKCVEVEALNALCEQYKAQVAKLQAVAVDLASGPSSLDKLRAINPAYGGMACVVLLRDIHALQAVADALKAWMATTDLSEVTDYGPDDPEWTTWWVLQYALAALESAVPTVASHGATLVDAARDVCADLGPCEYYNGECTVHNYAARPCPVERLRAALEVRNA